MATPKGLDISSSTHRFCGDVVSPWVTEHWANHSTTREHYPRLRSVFYAGCPTTTESTKHLHFGAALLKKGKKRPCFYATLLTQCFVYSLTLFANWYVSRINFKICKKSYKKNLTMGLKTDLALPQLPWMTCRHCMYLEMIDKLTNK
jgi:hypothetical protein